MKGIISYHFVGGTFPYGVKLKSTVYSDNVWSFSETDYAEARKNLIENLLPPKAAWHIPPDEEIEF